jgi:hypothetical protein
MEFINEMFECGIEETNLYLLLNNYIDEMFHFRTTFNNRLGSNCVRDMIKRIHCKKIKEHNDFERYYNINNDYNKSEYISYELVIYCMIKKGFRYKSITINNKTYYKFNVGVKRSIMDYVYS